MGLIKTSATLGVIYLLADKGMKAYNKHEHSKNQNHRTEAPQPGSCSSSQTQWASNGVHESSSKHQAWCNGQCGGQCNSNSFHTRRRPQDLPLSEGSEFHGMKQITASGDGPGMDSLPIYAQGQHDFSQDRNPSASDDAVYKS